MQSSIFLLLPVVLCFLVVSAGCEDKRYQPAEWNSTTLPGKMDESSESSRAKSAGAQNSPDKPTDWMTMVGKGGGNVKGRNTSLPTAANRGGTMPARRMGTSLPARGAGGTSLPARRINGSTLPARQPRYQSGTTMPARKGTTLPRR